MLFESVPETLAEIQAAREWALRHNGAEGGRIRPMMAAHATDTHTPETLTAVLEAAREIGNGVQLHLAQRQREVVATNRLWGMRPVEWLEDLELYSVPLFAAHLFCMDLERDPPILARHGVTYAHCPAIGGIIHGATQPYPEALAGGVTVSIGIDTHSNDYLENIKLAVLYGRLRCSFLREGSAAPMHWPTVEDAVRNATADPALGLGRVDLGRIAPGARADLCTVDVSSPLVGPGRTPPEPLHHLLYANGNSVRHVMTDGNWQRYDGCSVFGDDPAVIKRGGAVVEMLWRELDREGWFDSEPPPDARD